MSSNPAPDDDLRLVADAAERLFADAIRPAHREAAESGRWADAAEPAAGLQPLWQQITEAGFALLLAHPDADGHGLPWTAAAAVLMAAGAHQLPLPLAETLVAAQLLSMAGLPVPAGPLTLLQQTSPLATLRQHGPQQLSGQAHGVPWARHAQAAAVALDDGRIGLLALREGSSAAAGVQIAPHTNTASLPHDSLTLQQVRLQAVGTLPTGLALAQPVLTLGALARAAQLTGTLTAVLQMSVRYAGERVQFGKPIGRYQAIQQNLALMAGDVAAARMATLVAAADAPGAQPDAAGNWPDAQRARFSTAVAKVRCGEAASRAANIAHQVHGAIGFTREHPLHHATRRLWAWREEFGSDADWAAELGRQAIGAGSAGFWPGITRRRLPAAA